MSRVFETIKIANGEAQNIYYHWERIKWTFKELYKSKPFFNLYELLQGIKFTDGILRFKLIYNQTDVEYHIFNYQRKRIDYFYIVEDDYIDYRFKYEDRSALERYCRKDYGEPIFVKNKMITDNSFGNLAFFDGVKWITPVSYLLKGTRRSKLLKEGVLIEDEIFVSDLKYFKKLAIINSMNELGELCFQVDKII
jgi:4-amino-4-deoxychorismate lyase